VDNACNVVPQADMPEANAAEVTVEALHPADALLVAISLITADGGFSPVSVLPSSEAFTPKDKSPPGVTMQEQHDSISSLGSKA